MSDKKSSDKHKPHKLVRVDGKGDDKQVFDSYGHEIQEEVSPESAKKRVHPSHTDEVKKTIEATQTADKTDIQQDKLRSHQARQIQRKQKKKRTILAVLRVSIFVMCIAILGLIVLLSGKMRQSVNTQYIRTGTIDTAQSGTISFLRNEIPVQASHAGSFVTYVNEGDRVSKDALIGYVIQPGYEDQLAKLRTVESKLTAAYQASSYVNATKSPELLVIEDAIANTILTLSKMAMTGDLSAYSECVQELDQLYKEKNDILMNTETTDSYLLGLQEERNAILAEINSSMHAVVAPESGVVSFCTDGKEAQVSQAFAALVAQMAQTSFDTPSSYTVSGHVLEAFRLPGSSLQQMAGSHVASSSVVARISPDVTYYATMEMKDGQGISVEPGKTVTVRSNAGNLSFSASVCGTYQTEDRTLLVLSCKRALMATVSQRQIDGEVIFNHTEGLKVPLRALTEWDEAGVTARLTVVRSGYVEYVYVNILAIDDDYAIINSKSSLDNSNGISVRENDAYVVEYEKVKEGQVL